MVSFNMVTMEAIFADKKQSKIDYFDTQLCFTTHLGIFLFNARLFLLHTGNGSLLLNHSDQRLHLLSFLIHYNLFLSKYNLYVSSNNKKICQLFHDKILISTLSDNMMANTLAKKYI